MNNENALPFKSISAPELAELLKQDTEIVLLDVREPHEYAYCKLEGANLCSMSNFVESFEALLLKPESIIALYCHHGVRSARAATYLHEKGYTNLFNLIGGIDAWSQEVDSGIPLY